VRPARPRRTQPIDRERRHRRRCCGLRPGGLALVVVGALAAALPLSARGAGSPSVGDLSSALGGQRSRAQALATSARTLGAVISRLDAQIALIEARRMAIESELAADRSSLDGVRADQAAGQAHLVRLVAQLGLARRVLARELVSGYEHDPPDVVSVVLAAHGFADLLDRLEYVRAAKRHEREVIAAATTAKARTEDAARRLAVLAARDRAITDAVAARARAVEAISQLLAARRAALADARAARLAALSATSARASQLQHALDKLKAELAAGAGQAYGRWAIPQAIVTCESGGQNLPPNYAGASGYYQFLPSTWAGLGGSTPAAYLAPKSEQDRLAAKLWDGGRGAHNWDCAAIVGIG
jgi:ABC-type transporter Mla subunit MlaD